MGQVSAAVHEAARTQSHPVPRVRPDPYVDPYRACLMRLMRLLDVLAERD